MLGANQQRQMAGRKMMITDAAPETIAKYTQPRQPPPGSQVDSRKEAALAAMAAAKGGGGGGGAAGKGPMGSRPGSASIFSGGGASRPSSARGKPKVALDSVWPDGKPEDVRQQQKAGVRDPAAMPFAQPPRGRPQHVGADIDFSDEFGGLNLRPPSHTGSARGGAPIGSGVGGVMGFGRNPPPPPAAPPAPFPRGPQLAPTPMLGGPSSGPLSLSGSGMSSSFGGPTSRTAAAANSFMGAPSSVQQAFASKQQQQQQQQPGYGGFRPLRAPQGNAPIFKIG
jgi:hypothetical protein